MNDNKFDVKDPAELLAEHYEEVTVDDSFRLELQQKTRVVVAGRQRQVRRKLALGLGTAAVLLVVAMVWQLAGMWPPAKQVADDLSAPKGTKTVEVTRQKGVQRHKEELKPGIHAPHGGVSNAIGQPEPPVTEHHNSPAPENSTEPVQDNGPVLALTWVQGAVTTGDGEQLRAGDRVDVRAVIRTGPNSRATLVSRRGSELTLAGDSEVALVSRSEVEIRKGRLFCSNRKEISRIETPAGTVQLLGTVVDTEVMEKEAVAVTVVEGKVKLSNSHGIALVDAGKRARMALSGAPEAGEAVDVPAETAWYHGRGSYQSDFGDVAYIVNRIPGVISEVWSAKVDGTDRHRVRAYLGGSVVDEVGPWLPGAQWLVMRTHTLNYSIPGYRHGARMLWLQEENMWLVNSATGQDKRIQIPDFWNPTNMAFSPDGERVAVSGVQCSLPIDPKKAQVGLWLYDLGSGSLTKLYDAMFYNPVSWSPDGDKVITSVGHISSTNHRLLSIDLITGGSTELPIQGAWARYSPDGKRLAYCADFKNAQSIWQNVPATGSVFVADLESGDEPLRVSPAQENAIDPQWSPDGKRIIYRTPDGLVRVVNSDGSGTRDIFCPGGDQSRLWSMCWAPGGEAVFVTVKAGVQNVRTLLVAADGSGVVSVLSDNQQGSNLPGEALSQTDAAAEAVQKAAEMYGAAVMLTFEAKVAQTRAHYQASADVFAGLVWEYPLSGISLEDSLTYANRALEMANRPDADILAESCETRLNYLESALIWTAATQGRFADSQSAMGRWVRTVPWGQVDWLRYDDRRHVDMLLRCPGSDRHRSVEYTYHAPADGKCPREGDVLVSCPLHPEHRIVWDKRMAERFEWAKKCVEKQ